MLIKFLSDESTMEAHIRLEGHRVKLEFSVPISDIETLISAGFQELNEHNQTVMSDFSDQIYLYHEDVEYYRFTTTNDADDVWTPQPDPPEPPTPVEPTLDEVKAQKITEMESTMSAVIANGVTVTLTDGTTGTFSLSSFNQTSLTNLRLMAEQTEDKDTPSIPWHVSDETIQCRYFSPTDMMLITNAAIALTTYNITFLRDLRIYINSLTTIDEVEAIIYDISALPQEYWSEVLIDIVSSISA